MTSMEDGSSSHACAGLIEGVPAHFPVAPDTINNHVKTCREEKKSLHFFAPEYGGKVISATGILTLFVDLLGSV